MNKDFVDTVYAPATAVGRTGLTVLRVSGAHALASLQAITRQDINNFPARTACLATLYDAENQIIDKPLILMFQAPHSFTGEDCVEYHLHGGRAVYQAITDFLAAQPHHRLAQAGEFTRRAFENGKMDLTQAEAVADLIHAETSLQRLQALDQMGGGLSALYQGWAQNLTKLLAYSEAGIDFADEDLPRTEIEAAIAPIMAQLMTGIKAHLADNHRGERIRDGIRIAIIGAPNAGKSSLINHLAGRDVAIVNEEAGTTRDIIEVMLDINGYPVILSDTAGLREADNKIEQEGIRRAMERATQADIKIALFDGSSPPDEQTTALIDTQSFCLYNKADLPDFKAIKKIENCAYQGAISTKTGQGINDFLKALGDYLPDIYQQTEQPSLTRSRHREALIQGLEALERAQYAPQIDMMAEDLRLALRYLGHITGKVDVEDLLDIVFRDFCIGK